MEPCPLDKINLSLLNQSGLDGECFKWSRQRTSAISAILMASQGARLCLLNSIPDNNLSALTVWLLINVGYPFHNYIINAVIKKHDSTIKVSK